MDKVDRLIEKIAECLDADRYLDTRHALVRQHEREINRPEVLYVLRRGYHEKKKDKFDARYRAWNYAVRGKTIDKRDLRIIVSFDESNVLIITAIDLNM